MRIATLNKADAIVLVTRVNEAIGISLVDNCVGGEGKLLSDALLGLTDLGKLAAGDDDAVLVDGKNIEFGAANGLDTGLGKSSLVPKEGIFGRVLFVGDYSALTAKVKAAMTLASLAPPLFRTM